jgi:hypothetical protein
MTQTVRIGNGTSSHIVNPDPLVAAMGPRPLCGGVRLARAQRITVTEGNTANCKRCQAAAEKLGL